jgi:hypothetical protein
MSYLFLNKLGYQLKTTDEAALAELRAAKNQLVETSIQNYLTNTAGKVVYMKFVPATSCSISQPGDLRSAGNTASSARMPPAIRSTAMSSRKISTLSGVTLTMADSFTGDLWKRTYALQHPLSVNSKKVDTEKEKYVALFNTLQDVEIDDLTFETRPSVRS